MVDELTSSLTSLIVVGTVVEGNEFAKSLANELRAKELDLL